MKLRFTAEAYHCIEVIGTWWRANRDRSPDLFLDELFRVVALLESAPKMGEIYRRGDPVIYRVLMKQTRHHLYYTLHDDEALIEVNLDWGTPLRGPPAL